MHRKENEIMNCIAQHTKGISIKEEESKKRFSNL
jgi:hypothetical protein